jgi:catechol 2,3-dioxygenase-like lactoylglutathione lyase family enzyme
MGKVTSLGHVGIYVSDYPMMRDFYTRVLGLTVTDEAAERGMCFLSAHPEDEHHEILLAAGRKTLDGSPQIQQLSFHTDSIQALREFRAAFIEEGVIITAEVTHGNAASVYFNDPEGNRLEVYYAIPVDWPQPFRQPIDFSLDDEGLLKQIDDMTFGARVKG